MSADGAAPDSLGAGWKALRAFFHEGTPALQAAVEAFAAAEAGIRAAGDPLQLTVWLLGTATALQYTRRPEPMEAGLQRARELVNVVTRAQGEAATIPYRTIVEAIFRDLADVIPAQAAEYLEAASEYSERTMRLARGSERDEWLAPALSSRGDLLLRQAGEDRRRIRRAVMTHQEARRRWPVRDGEGRAQAALRYGASLLAAGEAAKVEPVAREALAVFKAKNDRYHQAAAHLLLARALAALDQNEALDEQAAAVTLYGTLGCRWELTRAEAALA